MGLDPFPQPALVGDPRPVPRQSAQACGCPGTAQPQASLPLNSWQCPINNLCAKATATAACHRGAAGESRALPRTGAGKQEMWVQPSPDISLVMQFQLYSVLQCLWTRIVPCLPYRCRSWPVLTETIKQAQSKHHSTVTLALAPPGPAWVWKQSSWVY